MIIKDKGKVIPGADIRMSCVHNHAKRITDHYVHAIEKHPYFCDSIDDISDTDADTDLKMCRSLLTVEASLGEIEAVDIIQCELLEAVQAYAHGDIAHAVEECYDTISVLLRTIDVLEGRQKLRKNIPDEHKNN